jgi:hypothetical protein
MTEAEWLRATDPSPMLDYLHGPRVRRVKVHSGRRIPFEDYPHRRASDRQLRLFACACCRRIGHLYTPERLARGIAFMAEIRVELRTPFEPDCCVRAVDVAERVADGEGDPGHLAALRDAAHEADYPSHTHAATVPRLPDLDWDLMATGSAALAVGCAAGSDLVEISRAARYASRAVACQRSQLTRDYPENDPEEMAAQCRLLRDVVGNPFRPATPDPAWLTSTVVALAAGAYADRAFDRLPILADALQDAGCDHPDVLAHCRDPHLTHVRGCWVVDLVLGKS